MQLYRCTNCWRHFTPLSGIKTKYSPEIIAKALMFYYQGSTQEDVSKLLKKKHGVKIPIRSIGRWITKYKRVCTLSSERKQILRFFRKDALITQFALNHRQVYIFKKHEAKLAYLAPSLGVENGNKLQAYLYEVTQPSFPHGMFKDSDSNEENNNEKVILPVRYTQIQRSSQVTFDTLPFVTSPKQNNANDLATFGLFNPTNQLLLYSLALASRSRLPLKNFVCAWFDEKDYFQFYPLHAVHKKA